MRIFLFSFSLLWWIGISGAVLGQNTDPLAKPDSTKKFISLVNPGKGAKWDLGSTNRIDWVSNLNDSVQIELYRNDIFYGMLNPSAFSQVGDNQWNWTIPMGLKRGNNYQIHIINKLDKSMRGKSVPFAVQGEFRWKRLAIVVGGAAVITTTAAILLGGSRSRNLPEPPLPDGQ